MLFENSVGNRLRGRTSAVLARTCRAVLYVRSG
jgi:hypothetical protein